MHIICLLLLILLLSFFFFFLFLFFSSLILPQFVYIWICHWFFQSVQWCCKSIFHGLPFLPDHSTFLCRIVNVPVCLLICPSNLHFLFLTTCDTLSVSVMIIFHPSMFTVYGICRRLLTLLCYIVISNDNMSCHCKASVSISEPHSSWISQ